MSEVKGSLLTIILALLVFTAVSGIVVGSIKSKATEVSQTISEIQTKTQEQQGAAPGASV